jgi:hypothetical protein
LHDEVTSEGHTLLLLEVAIPNTVKNPTSDPSEMMPPNQYTATAPPTSAVGRVTNVSTARRSRLKTTTSRAKMPMAVISAKPRRRF